MISFDFQCGSDNVVVNNACFWTLCHICYSQKLFQVGNVSFVMIQARNTIGTIITDVTLYRLCLTSLCVNKCLVNSSVLTNYFPQHLQLSLFSCKCFLLLWRSMWYFNLNLHWQISQLYIFSFVWILTYFFSCWSLNASKVQSSHWKISLDLLCVVL